jgi:hypothetical protein
VQLGGAFLGAMTNLQKAAIRFAVSAGHFVRTEQLGFH